MSGLSPRSEDPGAVLKDGSAELWDQVRARVVAPGGLYFFSKAILLFPDLTRRTHFPLCRFLEDTERKSKLIEYPRRHLKTTLATVSWSLWRFAKLVAQGLDPALRIAIVSSTQVNSMRFLRQISAHPMNNNIFQTFFPELSPDRNEDIWNQNEITFPRSKIRDAPSIDTFGAGSKATSRHYDIIIEDDMVNEENWDSGPALEKAIALHQLAENLLEDVENSERLTNENAWVQYDLNHHIIDNEPETAVFSVGCSTGLNDHRSRHLTPEVQELTEAWDDGDTLWPERFGHEALKIIRQKVGNFIYNAQYENNPFDPDVVDFKEGDLRYWEPCQGKDPVYGGIIPACRIMPKTTRAPDGHVIETLPMEIVPRGGLYVTAAWDLATDSRTTRDRNALVVTGTDADERVFVLDVIAMKTDPLTFVIKVFDAMVKWQVVRCGVETVAFQRFMFQLLPKLLNDYNKGKPYAEHLGMGVFEEVKPLSGKSKEARIRFLVGVPFASGQVYIRDTFHEFLDEYSHFPKGKTDDVLDAFAYTALLWRPGDTLESLDEDLRRERKELDQRDAVTGY